MARTSQRDLVDRVTKGKLAKILDDAKSLDDAVDTLREKYEITVSRETLRRWKQAS